MKQQLKAASRTIMTALLALGIGLSFIGLATPAKASGGSGGVGSTAGKVDSIKVTKCEYAVTGAYVELLLKASSSDVSARLYAYLPSGALLGAVQNGGGSRYGGDVFVTLKVPASITFKSSSGGVITVPTVPFQP
jgi:hypothetical protein